MIKIYTSERCKYCDDLKNKLQLHKIKYNEIDVNNEDNRDESEKIFDFVGEIVVPIIVVKPHLLVPNKSFNTIDQAIDLIKSFI